MTMMCQTLVFTFIMKWLAAGILSRRERTSVRSSEIVFDR